MFPHSPSKLNRTPTERFVVTAKVNSLSNFSETVLEVYLVRGKSNFMHLIMNATSFKVNIASLIWDYLGQKIFNNCRKTQGVL